MLGWLFGKDKDKKPKYQATKEDEALAFYHALSPAKQELYHLLDEIKQYTSTFDLWKAMVENNDADLQRVLLSDIIPKCPPDLQERIKNIRARSSWAKPQQLLKAGYAGKDLPWDVIFPGWFTLPGGDEGLLQFSGEGHLMTIAPTGAGKGQGHILPALIDYKGSVIVLDPKGENYRETAWRRRWCGHVFKWAPFDDETDTFNPLDYVRSYDDARVLADLLIVMAERTDPFWDRSAKDLLVGLILYVKHAREPELQNMREVCRLLAPATEEYEEFLVSLKEMGEERLTELSNILSDQSDNVRMGIFQTLRSHLDVWRSDEITRATSRTSEDFDPGLFMLRQETGDMYVQGEHGEAGPSFEESVTPDGKVVDRTYIKGHADSVFIVISSDKIRSYASVLRVIIGVMLNEITKAVADSEKEWAANPTNKPVATPVMFLLDELPQLGYMDIIENTVAIARSARIRLWLFAQDLEQLRATYPKANSLIANCRMKLFFKPGDLSTAQYVSDNLGEVTSLFGEKSPLATPQELMGPAYDDDQIVIARGVPPIKSRLRLKYADPELKDFELAHRAYWEKQPDRKELQGRVSNTPN